MVLTSKGIPSESKVVETVENNYEIRKDEDGKLYCYSTKKEKAVVEKAEEVKEVKKVKKKKKK